MSCIYILITFNDSDRDRICTAFHQLVLVRCKSKKKQQRRTDVAQKEDDEVPSPDREIPESDDDDATLAPLAISARARAACPTAGAKQSELATPMLVYMYACIYMRKLLRPD